MNEIIFLFDNTILITACIIMALVFLFVPLTDQKGLKNYRISLKFLSLSYLLLAFFTYVEIINENAALSFVIVLISFSFQTLLFSFTLINLLNPFFIKKRNVIFYLIPTLIYILLSLTFTNIRSFSELPPTNNTLLKLHYPNDGLNYIFLIYCILQMLYFLYKFESESKKYKLKLNDFFADIYQLRLSWVKYFFYGAFIYGSLMAFSVSISSLTFNLIVTGISVVFYTLFGLYYLQYPKTYIKIEPALNDLNPDYKKETGIIKHSVSWESLKSAVINEKYYLKQGITIVEMAQFLKIGRTTLSNYINKEEGMNFYAWINKLRIEEAQKILTEKPEYSITQVSEIVGFSETSNFSRQFRTITDQSPSDWKNKQKN